MLEINGLAASINDKPILRGIDLAVLSSAAGMSSSLELSKLVNDKAKQAEKDYPGRFLGFAHANPLGGPDALRARIAQEVPMWRDVIEKAGIKAE